MTNYDDLRSSFADADDDDASPRQSRIAVDVDDIFDERSQRPLARNTRFLGMTAGERAFISVMIFFVVLIIGMTVLVLTGRLVF